jgi:hypothetical protein
MLFVAGECIRHDQEEIDAYVQGLIAAVMTQPEGSGAWMRAGERLNGYLGDRPSLKVGRFTIHQAGWRVTITEDGNEPDQKEATA